MKRNGLLLIVLLLLSACASEVDPERPGGPELYVVPIGSEPDDETRQREPTLAYVELAYTPRDRSTGLMGRRALRTDTGMLFIYGVAEERSFWMKNTLIPLSIAFAEEGGRIVRILDMTPDPGDGGDLPHYRSGEPAIYALEMERGWFEKKGIREGDRMLFHPSIMAVRPR